MLSKQGYRDHKYGKEHYVAEVTIEILDTLKKILSIMEKNDVKPIKLAKGTEFKSIPVQKRNRGAKPNKRADGTKKVVKGGKG